MQVRFVLGFANLTTPSLHSVARLICEVIRCLRKYKDISGGYMR